MEMRELVVRGTEHGGVVTEPHHRSACRLRLLASWAWHVLTPHWFVCGVRLQAISLLQLEGKAAEAREEEDAAHSAQRDPEEVRRDS
jgi:hypothetical protein